MSYKALARHKKRPKASRKKDESRTSKIVYNDYTEAWSKHPERSDVKGIDTKKKKAKSIKEVRQFISGVIPVKKVPKSKSLISVTKPLANKQKQLQRVSNVRFSNVKIRKRKKKNTPNDYRISIRK